ncbi:MAG: arylsulfatase [Verrucomicrobiota bacterium JB025]|nr:arylsulfatase [Verrucomicrobiota bacterium JB025]
MKHLLTLLFGLTLATISAKTEKPNVILIFADDMGPGMLGTYGQQVVTTPHIDRLAAEGIKFRNYYGAVWCAPSRWSLATGMHDGRKGGWSHTRGGLPIQRDSGAITEAEFQKRMAAHKANALPIPDNEVFLGQIGQQAGYVTAQFGKLDRGFLTWHERVKRFGWDHYEGYFDHVRCHGFYPPYIWRDGEKVELKGNHMDDCGKTSEKGTEPIGYGGETYSQNVFIEGILKFIRENKDKPFFIYHPTQLPHGPVAIPEIHPDFKDDSRLSFAEKKYASMVKMLDDHVGLIMEEVKKQGIDDNTIVFFSSDNGHELYYGPKPAYKNQTLPNGEKANLTDKKWRSSECGDVFDGAGGRAGLKRSGYQGGIQCPMIVRWPGKIKPATETNHLSAHYDFLATLADIGGVEVPKGKDSISYLPTLLGQPQKENHDFIFVRNNFRQMGGHALVTQAGWKLVQDTKHKNQYQLYNIQTDNEERHELSAEHPELVDRLRKTMLEQVNSDRPDL